MEPRKNRSKNLEERRRRADIWDVDEMAKDLAAYEAALPTLLADAGKYALFFQGKHHGTFDTYAQALTKGYELAGIKPFLVQQISALPSAAHFSRALNFGCPTS